MSSFKDNFSKQASLYRQYRPTYPAELFTYLSSLTAEHTLAWDCGTGNGQCAIGLTPYYQKIYATDPSEAQLQHAQLHPQVMYKTEKAEEPTLDNNSVDLITVAQALHWFHFESFYASAKRVLKKNGVMAAWCYGLPEISSDIDALVRHLHDEVLGRYWLPENRMIEQEYRTIPFPFESISAPEFTMQKEWCFHALMGWFSTWSALQRYLREQEQDPLIPFEKELQKAWGDPESIKTVRWKLILKLGKNT